MRHAPFSHLKARVAGRVRGRELLDSKAMSGMLLQKEILLEVLTADSSFHFERLLLQTNTDHRDQYD